MISAVAQFHGLSSDEARERILRLHSQGWSFSQLGSTFLIDVGQVRQIIIESGHFVHGLSPEELFDCVRQLFYTRNWTALRIARRFKVSLQEVEKIVVAEPKVQVRP